MAMLLIAVSGTAPTMPPHLRAWRIIEQVIKKTSVGIVCPVLTHTDYSEFIEGLHIGMILVILGQMKI
jgi:hypothetical protein